MELFLQVKPVLSFQPANFPLEACAELPVEFFAAYLCKKLLVLIFIDSKCMPAVGACDLMHAICRSILIAVGAFFFCNRCHGFYSTREAVSPAGGCSETR